MPDACLMPAESIDVAVLTLNSERLLKECLDSVYTNIPVHNLIVIDGFSTDGTRDIVKQFEKKYGNVILVQEKGTRGSARQTAIELAKTDWFMFVDSDVILSRDWFVKAQKFMKQEVGAVWGIEIWSVMKRSIILRMFERVTLKIFEKRGGTHDILVRRKTVEDIKIPFELHFYEDGYIKDWIERKGFKVLGVYEPCCIHFRADSIWSLQKHIEFSVNDIKYAFKRPILFFSYSVYSIIVAYQIVSSKLKRRY
jgi:glycosyltransferase involved in cell wall biosynthesis